MNDTPTRTVKPRKKRRVEGSATPPRVSFSVRMEQAQYEEFTELLKTYSGSRNDYICYLISTVLKHKQLFEK
jgi:hypothetical protein